MELPFEKIEREVLIREDAEGELGQYPQERTIEENIDNGVIVLNKPPGPTSHQTTDFLKKILKIHKAGHSGTLDPNVSGVLVIATGRATRILQTLLHAGKEYICIMHVHNEVEEEKLRKAMNSFIGRIKQLPPIRCAVKRQERYKKIYYIDILEIKERDVLFRVGCQAGTYIRKLCSDIGDKLGTGAHMAELIRTKAGPFRYEQANTLHDLADAFHYYKKGDKSTLKKMIMPIERAVDHIPKIWVFDSTIKSLSHGSDLNIPGIAKIQSKIQKDELVAIMSLKNELICIGTSQFTSKQIIEKKKGKAVITSKVFI